MFGGTLKKILIVGASSYQLPGILKAKEMGLWTAVLDQNPNAPGVAYADTFFEVSTTDEAGVLEAATSFGADAIFTLATDQPMRAVAFASERLNLPGLTYDVAVRATDKFCQMETLKEMGVPIPWFLRVKESERLNPKEIPSFPCISKPVDSSGSRGVIYISDPDELNQSIVYSASFGKNKEVILQEFMEGPEVSCEMLVIDGQPVLLQVTDKITSGKPHFVEIGHSQPSSLPKAALAAIEKVACDACRAIGIKNSATHVEIMLTCDGPKIVELGARMGGDLIGTHLVELSTGIDMTRAAIMLALGLKPVIECGQPRASATSFMLANSGWVKKIGGVDKAQSQEGVQALFMFAREGDRIQQLKNGSDRLGQVVATADTPREALARCKKALSFIDIMVSDQN